MLQTDWTRYLWQKSTPFGCACIWKLTAGLIQKLNCPLRAIEIVSSANVMAPGKCEPRVRVEVIPGMARTPSVFGKIRIRNMLWIKEIEKP
jgi:hypothetical protein